MYTAKGQLQDSNALLKQYSPLVRRLAHQMIAKLPANVELDDLIQVGMIGLNDALSRFDANQGVQFETFATQRIRGAMLDELRGGDWMSRGDRRHQRAIESAVHKLEQKLQRAPNESEIADDTPRRASSAPSKATSSSPAGFPRVEPETQKSRDEMRRKVLGDELASEEKLLGEARAAYGNGAPAPLAEEKNDAEKYRQRIARLRQAVQVHERNVEALRKEIAAIR